MSSAQYAQLAQQAIQQAGQMGGSWNTALGLFTKSSGLRPPQNSKVLSPYWQEAKARGMTPPSKAKSPRASSPRARLPRGVSFAPQLATYRTSGQSAYPSQLRAWLPSDGYSQYGQYY